MMKVKVWVARDSNNDLRLHVDNPYWVESEVEGGYFYSDHRNWQISPDEFISLSKGEKKCVWMSYRLGEY